MRKSWRKVPPCPGAAQGGQGQRGRPGYGVGAGAGALPRYGQADGRDAVRTMGPEGPGCSVPRAPGGTSSAPTAPGHPVLEGQGLPLSCLLPSPAQSGTRRLLQSQVLSWAGQGCTLLHGVPPLTGARGLPSRPVFCPALLLCPASTSDLRCLPPPPHRRARQHACPSAGPTILPPGFPPAPAPPWGRAGTCF